MNIKIKNPNKLPTTDYRCVAPLQGDLKELNEENFAKLEQVLRQRGFEIPLFIWKDGDDLYLLDGHQRQRVMKECDMNDGGSYQVPYLEIEATDEKEAKAKLLEITSQYGKIGYDTLDKYIAEAQLPEAELIQTISFDALPLIGKEAPDENKAKKRKLLTCPECQFEGEESQFKHKYEDRFA